MKRDDKCLQCDGTGYHTDDCPSVRTATILPLPVKPIADNRIDPMVLSLRQSQVDGLVKLAAVMLDTKTFDPNACRVLAVAARRILDTVQR